MTCCSVPILFSSHKLQYLLSLSIPFFRRYSMGRQCPEILIAVKFLFSSGGRFESKYFSNWYVFFLFCDIKDTYRIFTDNHGDVTLTTKTQAWCDYTGYITAGHTLHLRLHLGTNSGEQNFPKTGHHGRKSGFTQAGDTRISGKYWQVTTQIVATEPLPNFAQSIRVLESWHLLNFVVTMCIKS